MWVSAATINMILFWFAPRTSKYIWGPTTGRVWLLANRSWEFRNLLVYFYLFVRVSPGAHSDIPAFGQSAHLFEILPLFVSSFSLLLDFEQINRYLITSHWVFPVFLYWYLQTLFVRFEVHRENVKVIGAHFWNYGVIDFWVLVELLDLNFLRTLTMIWLYLLFRLILRCINIKRIFWKNSTHSFWSFKL